MARSRRGGKRAQSEERESVSPNPELEDKNTLEVPSKQVGFPHRQTRNTPNNLQDTLNPGETPLSEREKKRQTFITRTIWTFVMIGVFFAMMASGHLYLIGVVTAVQVITFKEVIAIANVPSREKQLRFTKTINWYFLATTMFFLYGESVIYYFKHIVLVDALLLPFATHHRFISFILYMIGMASLYMFTESY